MGFFTNSVRWVGVQFLNSPWSFSRSARCICLTPLLHLSLNTLAGLTGLFSTAASCLACKIDGFAILATLIANAAAVLGFTSTFPVTVFHAQKLSPTATTSAQPRPIASTVGLKKEKSSAANALNSSKDCAMMQGHAAITCERQSGRHRSGSCGQPPRFHFLESPSHTFGLRQNR
jgi:hypothetical protein